MRTIMTSAEIIAEQAPPICSEDFADEEAATGLQHPPSLTEDQRGIGDFST